jgi:hypothetical protein
MWMPNNTRARTHIWIFQCSNDIKAYYTLSCNLSINNTSYIYNKPPNGTYHMRAFWLILLRINSTNSSYQCCFQRSPILATVYLPFPFSHKCPTHWQPSINVFLYDMPTTSRYSTLLLFSWSIAFSSGISRRRRYRPSVSLHIYRCYPTPLHEELGNLPIFWSNISFFSSSTI